MESKEGCNCCMPREFMPCDRIKNQYVFSEESHFNMRLAIYIDIDKELFDDLILSEASEIKKEILTGQKNKHIAIMAAQVSKARSRVFSNPHSQEPALRAFRTSWNFNEN